MSQNDRYRIESAIASRSLLNPVRWLLRAGVVRPHHSWPDALSWPFSVDRWELWVVAWRGRERVGLFRNIPGVVRDLGTWLPRRWGFYVLGFEFGQRG